MKPISLCDLDDTLFQTMRKITGYDESELVIASHASNGSHSYMTPEQVAMSDWLISTTEAIPVTARSSDVLSRVTLKFDSYAIVSNGAVILGRDGKPDPEWHALVSEALVPLAPMFDELLEAGKAKADELGVSMRCWVVMEGDMATYVVFKENDGDGSRLQEIAPIIDLAGWVRHHNGNNLALIPPMISKRLAAEFLLARLHKEMPGRPVIGYGDSISDWSYMSLCDMWTAPARSQITKLFVSAIESK